MAAEINPVEMNVPAEINPEESPVDYKPWFDAVKRNDWCAAKQFLALHPSATTATDEKGNTALHYAADRRHEQIVEELVQLMTEEQLETKNNLGETALAIAADAEINIKIVECLVAKNKKLLGIAQDYRQMTPIVIAAKKQRWDIVRYLYSVTPPEDLKPDKGPCGSELVCYCLQAKQFGNETTLNRIKFSAIYIIYIHIYVPFIAANEGLEKIVEELVQLMTEEQLETKNYDGETALTIAAAKNLKIVKCLVAKNKKLLGIAQYSSQMTPIVIAAKNGRWDIVRYLYSRTPIEYLKPDKFPRGSALVTYCLHAKQFDIAYDLLGRCPSFFCTQDLYEFAHLPFVFPSGMSLKFWQRWIYKCIHVKHALSVVDVRINVQNQENEQGDQRNSTVLGLLQGLPSRLSEFLGINHIRELKLHHVRLLKILDIAHDLIKDFNNEEMTASHHELHHTVLRAAQNGIVELVITLCQAKPQLLDTKGRDEKSIFHHAVECRQENVYSLIYGTDKRNYLATSKDSSGNSMLDYAGMLSPSKKLDGITGAALQMQRERQWYKEVESIVVTAPGASPFKEDCLKAAELFTKNHKELHEKGEKWMKDTASSYIIVSALIITIMFAAVFTVPGGNNQETGFPVFLNKKLFMVFIVSDATSLFASVTSALMFLCILTSRYAEDDFLKSLPTKMIIGLSTLFISIATMMIAFSSAIFLMLRDKSEIITPIIFLAGVPVILFVWMQFPLLVEIFVSTYGRGIFVGKSKRWI